MSDLLEPSLDRSLVSDAAFEGAWQPAGALTQAALDIEHQHSDSGVALKEMVRLFGKQGLLRLVAPDSPHGALGICLARERLGFASPLCELAFAMQGLGSHPLTLGSTDVARTWHERALAGTAVAAFALTERNAGSDLGGIATVAQENGDGFILHGEKVTISNAPVADFFVVFAKSHPDAPASRQLSAFVVPRELDGVQDRKSVV